MYRCPHLLQIDPKNLGTPPMFLSVHHQGLGIAYSFLIFCNLLKMNKVKKIFIFSSQKIFLIKCKSGVLCWWIKHENLFYSYVFVRRHCPKAKQVQSIYRAIAACEKPRSHFLGTKNAVPYLFFSFYTRQRWKENLAIKCWTVYYIVLLYK